LVAALTGEPGTGDRLQQYASLVPNLAGMARSLVRDIDPKNDLQFLRVRSKQHEIMVYADKEFSLIVVQDPYGEQQ